MLRLNRIDNLLKEAEDLEEPSYRDTISPDREKHQHAISDRIGESLDSYEGSIVH